MRKQVVKFVSYFMLSVFLLGVAPKEYLHQLLYQHEDTVHHKLEKGELVISDKHTHCSFLGFVFAPFVATEQQFLTFKQISCFTSYSQAFYHCSFSATYKVVSLRGPPSCLASLV